MKAVFVLLAIALISGGCARNRIMQAPDLPTAVTAVSEELTSRASKAEMQKKTVILTSIVDVNNLRQSSDFGRLYSDSLMTNFERYGWNVVDYRGVEVISEVKEGEFYLDRSKLKQFGDDYYVTVGTYGEYKKGLLVNVRILDHTNNKLVVSSNVLINDPETVRLSRKSNCKDLTCCELTRSCGKKPPFEMRIVKDDCQPGQRCENSKTAE